MAEPIEMPFGLWTQVGRRKHKFSRIRAGGANVPSQEGILSPPGEYN